LDLDSLTVWAAPATKMPWAVQGGGAHGVLPAIQLRLAMPGAGFEGWSSGHRVVGPLAATDTLWLGEEGMDGRIASPSIRWSGRTWRGRAKVFLGPRGRLTLALRLPLESYLAGVVPGEIGGLTDALIEAGRAQSVAARSYTLYYRGRRGPEGFDLYGTVEDQVYGPVENERPLATRCTETTRGQVALYAGQPIRANYCSTCGGITAEVWEGWPAQDFPYLRSERDAGPHGDFCAGSAQFRWREEWTAPDFLKTIARYAVGEGVSLPAPGMGDLVDVVVTARSRSGRVWRLVVTTSTGEISIPAYAIRRVLRRPGSGTQVLRSNLFKVDVRREPRTRRAVAVVASGAGSGHGVGLCQTGALGMARAGESAEKILDHYYPGNTLKRLY
jgi:stage II sporulation protein D